MHLKIDFIDQAGFIGGTEEQFKISWNLSHLPVIQQGIAQQKEANKKSISCVTVMGRWIVVYREDFDEADSAGMTFIDFRMNLQPIEQSEIFSANTLSNIEVLQQEVEANINSIVDKVELSFADVHEIPLTDCLYICEEDAVVQKKAEALGSWLALQTLNKGETLKMVLVDEQQRLNDREIINAYAFLHFGDHSSKSRENGYSYIKFFDLVKNVDKIGDFVLAINRAGGQIDRAFLMARFTQAQYN